MPQSHIHSPFLIALVLLAGVAMPAGSAGEGKRQQPALLRHDASVFFVRFAAEGRLLLSAGLDETLRIWDTASGREVRRLPLKGEVKSLTLALSGDGTTLALATEDKGLQVFDVFSGKQLRRPSPKEVNMIDSGDGFTRRWAELSHDGKLLLIWVVGVSGKGNRIGVWATATGKRRLLVDASEGACVEWAALSLDGKTLVALETQIPTQGRGKQWLRSWEVATGHDRGLVPIRPSQMDFFCILADSKHILGAMVDGQTACLVNAATGRTVHRLKLGQDVCRVANSPDCRRLFALARDGLVEWDVVKGKEVRKIALPLDNTEEVIAVALSPDGRLFATAAGSTVRLWDTRTGKEALPEKSR